ncbi:hypothetical protein ABW17_29175 [Mycobacterium nebraskense]|nr:hypothetical protein ABW17_29175 [Mycobacterium nebraskense]
MWTLLHCALLRRIGNAPPPERDKGVRPTGGTSLSADNAKRWADIAHGHADIRNGASEAGKT